MFSSAGLNFFLGGIKFFNSAEMFQLGGIKFSNSARLEKKTKKNEQ